MGVGGNSVVKCEGCAWDQHALCASGPSHIPSYQQKQMGLGMGGGGQSSSSGESLPPY